MKTQFSSPLIKRDDWISLCIFPLRYEHFINILYLLISFRIQSFFYQSLFFLLSFSKYLNYPNFIDLRFLWMLHSCFKNNRSFDGFSLIFWQSILHNNYKTYSYLSYQECRAILIFLRLILQIWKGAWLGVKII